MATATTTHLQLTTVEAGDQLPEAVVKDNFETLDAYVAARSMTNKSGQSVSAGMVVTVYTSADNSFQLTTTDGDTKVVGVVQASILNDAAGVVKVYGATTLQTDGTAVRGDWLKTSTTAGKATPVTATDPPSGAFALALTAVTGAGTITALLLTSAGPTNAQLPTSAAPSQTTAGQLEWGTTNKVLTVGDGTNNRSITPDDQVFKYKAAAQQFSADTTFADITASSGNFAFPVVASGVYRARFVLPLTHGGTGGVKIQFTGPAAATLVRYDSLASAVWVAQSNDSGAATETSVLAAAELDAGTAFSSSGGLNSVTSAPTSGTSGTNLLAANTIVTIDLLVINGANAGTVTLQGAQNSANSTTDFVAGCWMEARRVA